MTRIFTAYIATGIAFALIDSIWLKTMSVRLYQPEIGGLLAKDGFRLAPAVTFYLLYIAGMLYFAVIPALGAGKWHMALLNGAILGFMCYMTYDLTNQATLKLWSLKVTLADIAWGTILTGSASLAGYALTSVLTARP